MSEPALSLSAWLRWDVVRRVLDEFPGVGSVLEIGAGRGGFAVRLAKRYEYVGVEPDAASYAVARERLAALGRGTILHGDVSAVEDDRRFELVCAFEVLEHVADDAGALAEWIGRLRPGGRLVLSVPAWQRRFGASDRAVGHFRRYDRRPLAALLGRTGLEDVRIRAYGFPLGYVLQPLWNLAAGRRLPRDSRPERTAASGRWLQAPDGLAWATRAASAPFRLAQRPFAGTDLGTGFVVSAATTIGAHVRDPRDRGLPER